VAGESSLFKSALHPLRLTFRTPEEGGSCKLIFKKGDDLRQDQLVYSVHYIILSVIFVYVVIFFHYSIGCSNGLAHG